MARKGNLIRDIGNGVSILWYLYGRYSFFDTEDTTKILGFTWNINSEGYVSAFSHLDGEKRVQVLLHRLLMGFPDGKHIDHVNHKPFDNRKVNLRECTHIQNNQNRRKRSGCTSQYKGVSWYKTKKRYIAAITYNKKRIKLGYFKSEYDAAKAYDEAALKYFGPFAKLNFPF